QAVRAAFPRQPGVAARTGGARHGALGRDDQGRGHRARIRATRALPLTQRKTSRRPGPARGRAPSRMATARRTRGGALPVPRRSFPSMLGFLPPLARGVLAFLLLVINTLFWCVLLFTFSLVKLVLP